MASTISRLKNTDSLAQWADKVNSLIGTVEGFLQTGGAFTSSSPSSADLLVYDAGWKNKTLIGEILIDTTYSNATQFKYKIDPTAITNRTASTSPDVSNDYLLIYDSGSSTLKKIAPRYIATPGGSAGQVQYNLGGTTFMGATGFTFNGTRLSTPSLSVATNVLYVDEINGRVGIGNSSPSYTLDVTGSANISGTYRIGGAQVLSSTALGSGVVSSSLTSLGTIAALVAGTGSFSGAVSALSLTVSNAIASATAAVTGNTTIGGTLGATGAVTFGSTLNVTGGTTVGGTLYTTGVATLSATTGVIKSGPQGNANIIGDFIPVSGSISVSVGLGYLVRANSITLTLPSSAGLADGDKISFVPSSTSINNYTIGRNNSTIMGSASDLIVNLYAPFSLQWDGTGSNWVLA